MGKCRICGIETNKNVFDENIFECDSCFTKFIVELTERESSSDEFPELYEN